MKSKEELLKESFTREIAQYFTVVDNYPVPIDEKNIEWYKDMGVSIGDTISESRVRDINPESGNDLEYVYRMKLKAENEIPATKEKDFIYDEIVKIDRWIKWVIENAPTFQHKGVIRRYKEFLEKKKNPENQSPEFINPLNLIKPELHKGISKNPSYEVTNRG